MQLPNTPSGSGPLATWLRRLLAYCRASEIKPGVNYKVRRGTTGTILEISPPSGGGTEPGVHYLGEWVSTTTYVTGDIVRKRTGTGKGVWICVLENTNISPEYPEPEDAATGANKWELIAFVPVEISRCVSGTTTTITVNGTTE